MKKIAAFLCLFMLSFCMAVGAAGIASATAKCDALVDAQYRGVNGALVNGLKTYNTVQQALQDVPANSVVPYVIFIKNGRYYEKLTIDKPYVSLVGQSKDGTIITYDAAADTKRPDGSTYGTFGSGTIIVTTPNFTAKNLTIENGFDYNANMKKDSKDSTRFANAQAVAFATVANSDKAVIYNCKLLGYQDTLYANAGRQYYKGCTISGNVDFIFGAGQAVFDQCDIISQDRESQTNNGYITAASTQLSNQYGFLFTNCRLLKGSAKMASNSVRLGRPWHPTSNLPDGTRAADPRAVGSVVYKNCYMGAHIATAGWDSMSGKDKDGNKIWFDPAHSRFYEYKSYGPGAIKNAQRENLTEEEAAWYTMENVFAGWQPIVNR